MVNITSPTPMTSWGFLWPTDAEPPGTKVEWSQDQDAQVAMFAWVESQGLEDEVEFYTVLARDNQPIRHRAYFADPGRAMLFKLSF